MSTPAEELDIIIVEREEVSAADGFADVVEEHVRFDSTAEDYFGSILALPSPLCELYAALIFNSNVGSDGLPFAIVRYDHPEFLAALRDGLQLLGETSLLSLIELAHEHLEGETSKALQSETPNVTFDQEVPELSNAKYFSQCKSLMHKIGAFLKSNHQQVLAAARQLSAPAA